MSPSLRAFFFGTLAGLLVALAPSCGPVKNGCSSVTCPTGCCASDGSCKTGGSNTTDTSCGLGGLACSDCTASGKTCFNGVCTGGSGGGGGSGGCNASNCNGCCTGTSSTSVCFDPPTRTNCGAAGSLCQTCPQGSVCESGACVSLGDAGVLGRGCGDDSDCASLGPGHSCKKRTASQRDEYYNGYCTKDCNATSECGASGVCVEQDPGYGEVGTFCWLRCDTASDCRSPGYDCYPLGLGVKGCWISPLPAYDAGPPADKVGAQCGDDSECQNPPSDGLCLPSTQLDGGPTPYVGGYCTAPCDDSSHCSADGGAGCVLIGSGGAAIAACLRLCDGPNAGPSSCRTGYLCRGIRQPDGGTAPKGVCWPSCLNVGASCPTGTTCQANGYCQ